MVAGGVDQVDVVAVGEDARVPAAGGTPEVIAPDELLPRDLFVDDCCVYWLNSAASDLGGVRRMAKPL